MVNRFQLIDITNKNNLREHHDLSVTSQTVNIYLMNQAFFAFTFGFGDRINFDVHPFSGAISMRAYDTFKAFSAFLMAFHKYEVFMCAAQEECAAGFLCDMERCWCREASRVPAERTLPLPHVDCAAKRRALLEDSSKLEGRGECRRPEDGY